MKNDADSFPLHYTQVAGLYNEMHQYHHSTPNIDIVALAVSVCMLRRNIIASECIIAGTEFAVRNQFLESEIIFYDLSFPNTLAPYFKITPKTSYLNNAVTIPIGKMD